MSQTSNKITKICKKKNGKKSQTSVKKRRTCKENVTKSDKLVRKRQKLV